jgi:hypothetical protein
VFQAGEDLLRRENEAEMIFRAQEIARAIYRYRQDHRDTPHALEDLLKPGPRGQYYLRMRYRDPLVKDGVWGLLFDGPEGTLVDLAGQIAPERLLGFESDEELRQIGADREAGPGPRQDPGAAAIGRIAGVRTLATDKPFRVYRGFTEYPQWQFTYHDYEQSATPGGRPGQRARQAPGIGGDPALGGRDGRGGLGDRLGGGLGEGRLGGGRSGRNRDGDRR